MDPVSRRRPWVALALVLASTLVVLVAAELLLRTFSPALRRSSPYRALVAAR